MNQADITANGFDYDDEYDEYDDATSKNPHPSDSQAAIGDTDTAADNNTTTTTTANPSTDAVGSAPSTKKRTTIDESALSAEDLQKLESRRAYNRQCAAKGTPVATLSVRCDFTDNMLKPTVNLFSFCTQSSKT